MGIVFGPYSEDKCVLVIKVSVLLSGGRVLVSPSTTRHTRSCSDTPEGAGANGGLCALIFRLTTS